MEIESAKEEVNQSTILLVDDNSFNLFTLDLVLNEFCGGLKCDKALNGQEAVNMVVKNLHDGSEFKTINSIKRNCALCGKEQVQKRKLPSYKMIFMDIQMPIMDGYEASRQIAEIYSKWQTAQGVTDEQHSLKIVAVTAFTNE